MAANWEVKIKCTICETENTILDTDELAKGSIGVKEPRYQCTSCKTVFPISFTSIKLEHSGDVGAFPILTHTMATPGTIVTTPSG